MDIHEIHYTQTEPLCFSPKKSQRIASPPPPGKAFQEEAKPKAEAVCPGRRAPTCVCIVSVYIYISYYVIRFY